MHGAYVLKACNLCAVPRLTVVCPDTHQGGDLAGHEEGGSVLQQLLLFLNVLRAALWKPHTCRGTGEERERDIVIHECDLPMHLQSY